MKSDDNKRADANGGDTASDAGKSKKNKTLLIAAVAGCGGFLLLGCCATSSVVGGWYFFGRTSTTARPTVGKAAEATNKAVATVNKYKDLYDKIQIGMNNKKIEGLTGGRGDRITPSEMPRVTDKKLNPLVDKGLRENGVNLLFRWKDNGADGTLVIGYRTADAGDVAAFKAYFYMANNQYLAEYQFEKAVVGK